MHLNFYIFLYPMPQLTLTLYMHISRIPLPRMCTHMHPTCPHIFWYHHISHYITNLNSILYPYICLLCSRLTPPFFLYLTRITQPLLSMFLVPLYHYSYSYWPLPPLQPSDPPSGPPSSCPCAAPLVPKLTKPASLLLKPVLGKAPRFFGIDNVKGFFHSFDLWYCRCVLDDEDKVAVLST